MEFSEVLKGGPDINVIKNPLNFLLTTNILFLIVPIVFLILIVGIILIIKVQKRFPKEKEEPEDGEVRQLKSACNDLQQKLMALTTQIDESDGKKGELIVTLKRNEGRIQELQREKDELGVAKRKLELILKMHETSHPSEAQDKDLSRDIERYKDVLEHVSSLQERLAEPEEEVVVQEKSDLDSKDSQETSSLSDDEAKRIIDSSAALGKYLP